MNPEETKPEDKKGEELEERNVVLSISEVQSNNEKQPVTIDVNAPSDDLAERMANAFDKNLDKLIADVQAPPPPVKLKKPKKVKEVKVKKIKIKVYRYKPIEKKDSSFAEFLGRKISSSFSLAATARKNAKERGEETKPKGFFLKQALGFEFGGDLINRTKGTFSSDPTEEQDPSSNKGDRFAAALKNIKPPTDQPKVASASSVSTPYTQPSLFDTNKYVTVVDRSIGQCVKDYVGKLQKSFERVNKKLSDLSETKDQSISVSKQENTISEIISDRFTTVKESIKENNILRKTLNKIKQTQLNVQKKQAEQNENAAREASLEKGSDLSGSVKYSDPYSKQKEGKGLVQRAMDFISGDNGDDCECDDEGGGGGIDIDLPDRNPRRSRRPGVRRRLARRKFNNATRNIGKGIAEQGNRAKNFFVDKGKSVSKFLGDQGGKLLRAGQSGITKVGKFIADNPKIMRLGKAFGAFGGKAVPGVGAAVGAADAADRAARGDKVGAGIAAFGAGADAIPVAGTAVSWVTDLALLGKDIFDIFGGKQKKMSEGGMIKLSNGGVPAMVGEAGPELVTSPGQPLDLSSLVGMGSDPVKTSISTILGVTDKVIQNAGPAAGAVKPFVQQIIGPLAKVYGKPEFNITTKVGKNLNNIQEPNQEEGGILGLIKKIGSFLRGEDEDDGGSEGQSGTRGSAASDAGAYKDMLDLIAGVESTSSGGYEAFNRGGSAGGTVAHGSGNSAEVAIGGVIKPLTQRTVAEVMSLQASGDLHATGRYQIIASTLKGLMNGNYGDTGVQPTDLYDAVTQDKLGIALIKYRLKTGANATNFRNEWIGLQKVPDDKLIAAINGANAAYQANPNATAVASASTATPGAPSGSPGSAAPVVPGTQTNRRGSTAAVPSGTKPGTRPVAPVRQPASPLSNFNVLLSQSGSTAANTSLSEAFGVGGGGALRLRNPYDINSLHSAVLGQR